MKGGFCNDELRRNDKLVYVKVEREVQND